MVGGLAAAAVGYLAVPGGSGLQAVYYLVIAAAALLAAFLGVRVNRPRRRLMWLVLLAGLSSRLAGDITWFALERLLHASPFPSVADVFYLSGYPVMAVGLALMVRARQPGHDRAATLDAAIITTAAGILAAIFIIEPTVTDTSQRLLGRAVSTAYPLGDLLLLAVLARLWTSSGRALRAYHLLGLGLLFILGGDIGYDAAFLTTGLAPTGAALDLLYLLGYVSIAAATLTPTMQRLAEPPQEQDQSLPSPHLSALTGASMLAPAALLFEGIHNQALHWQIIGTGSMVISALVLARLGGLLGQVQRQAVLLAALARTDGLTGLPNRRTWDAELARACAAAGTDGLPLAVALLDLDHFKDFNDAAGHAEGDLLLKAATAAWASALPQDTFLARYGGEEFALLLPGFTTDKAHATVDALRAVTPMHQTFSAGIAGWDHTEAPAALVARADAAMYQAKRTGRARTLSGPTTPNLTPDHRADPGTAPHSPD
ncbi:MAG: hypothetical protein JWN35_1932 [Frankiales bacterium]|nr:hypothetical protein [Frankiales bacterium]